jgi:DNA replicative helicase MCM subunit Mcm2 (Cdc46/Mcm family)
MPREIVRMIALNQVKARSEAMDGDVVSNRRINSIGRLACAAAKLDLCDTVSREHAEFAIEVMKNTLMDESPAAAEGGKTSHQVNMNERIWNSLASMHAQLLQDSYETSEIVRHVQGEDSSVKRDAIVPALTSFVSTGKRHQRWGGLVRVRRGVYRFDND